MPPAAIPLELESVAGGALALPKDRGNRRLIRGVEAQAVGREHVGEVSRAPGTDDDAGDLRSVEHVAHRDGTDAGLMLLGDALQRAEQHLEQVRAAELVDDQLVLRERAVLERSRGLERPEPALSDEAARERAVAEEADAMACGERHEAVLRPRVEQRVLHLHARELHAGTDEGRSMRRVEIRAAELVDLARALQLDEVLCGLDQPRLRVVPPVELHEVEALLPEALARSVDRRLDRGAVDTRERAPIRHKLGVDLDPVERLPSALT